MPRKNSHSRSVVKHWKEEKEWENCLWHLVLPDTSGDSDNSEETVLSAVIPCPSAVPCSSAPLREAGLGSLALTVSHVAGPPVPHVAARASDAGFLALEESTLSLSNICLRKSLAPNADSSGVCGPLPMLLLLLEFSTYNHRQTDFMLHSKVGTIW